jgi:hypothetical protein
MPRKFIVFAAAVLSVLALAAGANAATYSFTSADETEIPTPNGFAVSGSLVNSVPQFGLPAGATVGRFAAELSFLSASSVSVTGVYLVPNGRIIIGGTFNPDLGLTQPFTARSLGTLRGSGTLSVIDDGIGGPSTYVFQLN